MNTVQVCKNAPLVRTSNRLSASRACLNSSAMIICMHVPAALCVSLAHLELLSSSTSFVVPLFYVEGVQLCHFYPINILIPLPAIHSLSTSTEELLMSETAVCRIWSIYPRTNFLAMEYGVVKVGQERSVEGWTVKIIFKWPSLSLLLGCCMEAVSQEGHLIE